VKSKYFRGAWRVPCYIGWLLVFRKNSLPPYLLQKGLNMEVLLFWYTFIAIYKISRGLISEAGALNVHCPLSVRSICPVF